MAALDKLGIGGMARPNQIFLKNRRKIFFTSGLDRRSRLLRLANFDLTRMRISRW